MDGSLANVVPLGSRGSSQQTALLRSRPERAPCSFPPRIQGQPSKYSPSHPGDDASQRPGPGSWIDALGPTPPFAPPTSLPGFTTLLWPQRMACMDFTNGLPVLSFLLGLASGRPWQETEGTRRERSRYNFLSSLPAGLCLSKVAFHTPSPSGFPEPLFSIKGVNSFTVESLGYCTMPSGFPKPCPHLCKWALQ